MHKKILNEATWSHRALLKVEGCCRGLYYSDVLVLNLDTMVWNTLITTGQSPGPRDSNGVILVSSKIIVFGGTNGSKKVNNLHKSSLIRCFTTSGGKVTQQEFAEMRAREYKKEYGDSFNSVEHLVLGFEEDVRFGKQLFMDLQITLQHLKSVVEAINRHQSVMEQDHEGKYEALEEHKISDLEMEIQKKIEERNMIQNKLNKASKEPGRKQIITEFKTWVSSFPEEINDMQGQQAGAALCMVIFSWKLLLRPKWLCSLD
ncbi:hypothetical protein ACFE04_030387 [Oxalis oulophora]